MKVFSKRLKFNYPKTVMIMHHELRVCTPENNFFFIMKRLLRTSLLIMIFSIVLFLYSQVHQNIKQTLALAENHSNYDNSVILNCLMHKEQFEKERITVAKNLAN